MNPHFDFRTVSFRNARNQVTALNVGQLQLLFGSGLFFFLELGE
jgi:hypothetical protein